MLKKIYIYIRHTHTHRPAAVL